MFATWFKRSNSLARSSKPRSRWRNRHPNFRPQLEALEDGLVLTPASFVTGLSDWKETGLGSTAPIAYAAPGHSTGGHSLLTAVDKAGPTGITVQNKMQTDALPQTITAAED